jgi:hypothetical protein
MKPQLYSKPKQQDANTIAALEVDYLYTQSSQIRNSGEGLYTAIDIFKGEIISVFKGDILEADAAKSKADLGLDQYFINLLDGRIMDSQPVHCFAKYANDANGFSSSLFKNNANIALNENEEVCLIAKFKIKAGQEIFCSYGKRYWERHKK